MTVTYPELSQVGRLGNQLWEIASTIGLAYDRGEVPRFPLWDYQPFFSVPEHFFVEKPRGTPATELVPKMDARARAYLQDFSLFAKHEEKIREYFQPSELALSVLDANDQGLGDLPEPLIAVHVRRGDNVTHPPGYHPLRSMRYYRDSLKLLPEGSVVVFSDDPDWCEENLADEIGRDVALVYRGVARPREYVDRVSYETAPVLDWIDLQMMTRCNHHVISNSTYAWWGAFLSTNPSPLYPSNWFGKLIRTWTDASLMFPPSWREVHDPTQGGV